jgi:hypothetical protein
MDQYKNYLLEKYSKQYAIAQLNNSMKYFALIENPSEMLTIPTTRRLNVLKAMTALSKYLGIYESYKSKLKSYGIRWTNEDTAFKGFLSIFSKNHDNLPQYIKEVMPALSENERLFLKFLAITGLRKNEALTSFNMIIDLAKQRRLGEYYNPDLSLLEHFKHKIFLRKTKNAYISFVPKTMIEEICNSQKVSFSAIHCRFMRGKLTETEGAKVLSQQLSSEDGLNLRVG